MAHSHLANIDEKYFAVLVINVRNYVGTNIQRFRVPSVGYEKKENT